MSEQPQPRYRYADSRIAFDSFTESEWIHAAAPHFIREEDDEAMYHLWIVNTIFAGHLADGNIVPDGGAKDRRPFKERMTPRCLHDLEFMQHTGRSFYLCLGCGFEGQIRGRPYFCYDCRHVHTKTWDELKEHERTEHFTTTTTGGT